MCFRRPPPVLVTVQVDVIAVLRSVGDTVSRVACGEIYNDREYIAV
jgi:hypothetical protein